MEPFHTRPSPPWSAPLILMISFSHPTPPKIKQTHRHTHTCVQFVLSMYSLEHGQIPHGKSLKNLVPTHTSARSHQIWIDSYTSAFTIFKFCG